MKHHSTYFDRYIYPKRLFESHPESNPDIIVVLPAYMEGEIDKSLIALQQCHAPKGEVMILVLINEPENTTAEITSINDVSFIKAQNVSSQYETHVFKIKLPEKKAGVGLARKIGMDEAVRIFTNNHKNGIIACFDADCICDKNYLQAVETFYSDNSNNLGMVHFEHQLERTHHQLILDYELHLRYYINAQRIANYPMAFQTLGSCITVKSLPYQKIGGMNSKKAGEDFYFIHKMVPQGGLGEINETTIYPADRSSNRVPFGTGHAISKQLENPSTTDYETYNPRIFEDLKYINLSLEYLYKTGTYNENLPISIVDFCQSQDFSLQQIIQGCRSFTSFCKKYYEWWDGFRVLKFVHFARDKYFPNVPLNSCLNWLFDKIHLEIPLTKEKQLEKLRKYDRDHTYYFRW